MRANAVEDRFRAAIQILRLKSCIKASIRRTIWLSTLGFLLDDPGAEANLVKTGTTHIIKLESRLALRVTHKTPSSPSHRSNLPVNNFKQRLDVLL